MASVLPKYMSKMKIADAPLLETLSRADVCKFTLGKQILKKIPGDLPKEEVKSKLELLVNDIKAAGKRPYKVSELNSMRNVAIKFPRPIEGVGWDVHNKVNNREEVIKILEFAKWRKDNFDINLENFAAMWWDYYQQLDTERSADLRIAKEEQKKAEKDLEHDRQLLNKAETAKEQVAARRMIEEAEEAKVQAEADINEYGIALAKPKVPMPKASTKLKAADVLQAYNLSTYALADAQKALAMLRDHKKNLTQTEVDAIREGWIQVKTVTESILDLVTTKQSGPSADVVKMPSRSPAA